MKEWPPKFDGWAANRTPGANDGYYTRTQEWSYRNESYEWELAIPESVYDYCSGRYRTHQYGVYLNDPQQKSFITDMVSRFENLAVDRGLTERETLEAMVRFVQSIPYSKDLEDTGHKAYPKYAVETLKHQQGDCEDGTILLGTLLNFFGYEVAVIIFPKANHMMLGVATEDQSGTYVESAGTRYSPIETTTEGWDFGELKPTYRNEHIELQRPDNQPILVHKWEARPNATGNVGASVQIANYGGAPAESVRVLLEFVRRTGDVVNRVQLNQERITLQPGDKESWSQDIRLTKNHELQGRCKIGIEGVIHDLSKSDWK